MASQGCWAQQALYCSIEELYDNYGRNHSECTSVRPHLDPSRSMYLIFRLFLNSFIFSWEAFLSCLAWIISFLYSFSLMSFSFTSFSFSFSISSFFSSSARLLLCSTSRFASFSPQTFSESLCSDSSLIIYSSSSAIISTVTMLLGIPFFIFSLFSLIFSSMSFIFLAFPTVLSWCFSSTFSFSAILLKSTLHYSFILCNWFLVFSTFYEYMRSPSTSFTTLCLSLRTFWSPALSFYSCSTCICNDLTSFSFYLIISSSQTYLFSFLTVSIQCFSCIM